MKRKYRDQRIRERQRRQDAKRRKYHKHHKQLFHRSQTIPYVQAPSRDEVPTKGFVNSPSSLSILSEVRGCVRFFSNIRNQANEVQFSGNRSVTLNIADITEIDLPTTMVLNALGRELSGRGISLRGNFPTDDSCREFFIRTGFLNDKVDGQGVRFSKSEATEFFSFNKGQGRLRIEDTIRICGIVRHACNHIGRDDFYDEVVSIIKEIAGNSIEWSQSFREQWTLGVMFEDSRVTFSILDLGRGILDTVYRRFIKRLRGLFDSDVAFLSDVFDKQYSSSSREENRYKGLPSIKKAFLDHKIQNLYVMTNSVLMCFANPSDSIQYSISRKAFNGTLYFWEIIK